MGFVFGTAFERRPDLPHAWIVKPPRIIRDLKGLPAVLARSGSLEMRLATIKAEIRKAQRLRYKVFFEEGGALATPAQKLIRRDTCAYDRFCDHLVVLDTMVPAQDGGVKTKVVGTYRLLRDDVARHSGAGFCSGNEFDVDPMIERHRSLRFLELGRSCVHRAYRSKRVIDLLWRGIGLYASHHGIDVLIGCASLPGTDAEALALPLSFAFHHAPAPAEWQVSAATGRAIRMNRLPRDEVDPRRTMATLPPLIKAYIRTGSLFASEAVADHQFGTTDLFTVLPLAGADRRTLTHFGQAPNG